ncbi:MAG: 16S rRNA (uracil(1498)-N(3))-methyltransferase [Hyphomonadaceae bacterium]
MARHESAMPDPRLYLDHALSAGARAPLDEGQSRKLTQVLRLKPGAGVRVFNARDGEWRAVLAPAGPRAFGVEIGARLRAPAPTPDLDLLFAPVKRDAVDLIVEKATELGVRRLRPVITARTIAETARLERWALIARAAAEQTERFDLPEIAAPVALARALGAWEAARPLIHADESGEVWGGAPAPPLLDALAARPRPAGAAVLIGPEGGFTPEERRMLQAQPFVIPVSLGPRILRAETAVIAALSVVQAVWGDWRAH